MSQTLCYFSGNVLHFTGTAEEFRRMLWQDYVKTGHWFVLDGVKTDPANLQELCDKALAYGRERVPHADTVRAKPRKEKARAEPGDYVVPFGKWNGEKLSELPINSIWGILQWAEMYPGPRKKIEAYVTWLRANPERAWMAYGKYDRQDLENIPTHYLDWLLGKDPTDGHKGDTPLLLELIGRVRESRRVCGDLYYDDPSHEVVFARLRTVDLGRVPFDTEGLIPSEARDDKPRPSGWYLSRKFYTNQLELDTSTPKRSPEERAAYPVMFSSVELVSGDGGETWSVPADDPRDAKGKLIKQKRQPGVRETRSLVRANDANRDRVDHWVFVLECIDKLEYAGEEDLKERYEDALAAVANLEECERVDARTLDVHGAYRRRKEELESRETPYVELFRDEIRLSQLGRRARGCESVEAFEDLATGLDAETFKKVEAAYVKAGKRVELNGSYPTLDEYVSDGKVRYLPQR